MTFPKNVDTLVSDINAVLDGSLPPQGGFEPLSATFGTEVGSVMFSRVTAEERTRPANTLYMSEIGKPCLRQIWYNYHQPADGEPIRGAASLKFMYGDVLESMVLTLAEAAGHSVTRRQESVGFDRSGWNVRGRIDAVIDGVLVDVKSASTYSFDKFQRGLDDTNDSFGYRAQLAGYRHAINANDPSARIERSGFLVVDKSLGNLAYVDCNDHFDVVKRADDVIRTVEDAKPPKRPYGPVDDGSSGNKKLGVECSYCSFKHLCWSDSNGGRGLRTFIYSRGPVFMTKVVREPNVPEV